MIMRSIYIPQLSSIANTALYAGLSLHRTEYQTTGTVDAEKDSMLADLGRKADLEVEGFGMASRKYHHGLWSEKRPGRDNRRS